MARTSSQRGGGRHRELAAGELRRACDLASLDFRTTADLPDFEGVLGQPRAMAAIGFGLGIRGDGFNLFAIGPQGLGKHSLLRSVLAERAASEPVPAEPCYVNNFAEPQRPLLLLLPAGRGAALKRGLELLVDELVSALSGAFESEQYQTRRQLIDQEMTERQEQAVAELDEEAKRHGLALLRTPMGIVFAPASDGEMLSPEDFEKLPQDRRKAITADVQRLQEELKRILRQVPRVQRERRERIRELDREVSEATVGPLLDELRGNHEDLPQVLEYLAAMQRDVVENARAFLAQDGQSAAGVKAPPEVEAGALGVEPPQRYPIGRRYAANLLVDHGSSRGAPVVFEDNPSYHNLLGRIEHLPRMGALVTDFTLIRPGALHRANGGYLILDADKLLQQPYAWPSLKRALKSRAISIESLAQALGLLSTYSLEPEPVPLAVKVVLVGERLLYYLLSLYDPDFPELFKVAADFDDQVDWEESNQVAYARLVARLLRQNGLRPFERPAVERIVEESARLVGDGRKLALYMSRVLDVLREADHTAAGAGREVVFASDVEQAIAARIYRSDRLRERLQEAIHRGTLLIGTEGSVVGQVNGLSVMQLGDFAFGRPSRITARVRLGAGEVVNIEREVELSGPLHSKGVLILAGFLGARFATEVPLSLAASLVFEQSYGGVDGDSASSAELYALLSAIGDVPLRQGLAVTGSVNQCGEVQAIGGVNEKIEGFFEVCAARGLDGSQGVLIPASNVEHLMLDQRVVDAVAAGTFHVYPVANVDEGLSILTGLPAGEPDDSGLYPPGSVNRHVQDRLAAFAERQRRFGARTRRRAPRAPTRPVPRRPRRPSDRDG